MKLVFTGDWQCSLGNLDKCEVVLEQVLSEIDKARDTCAVIHLGDIKDAFNPVDQRVTNFIVRAAAEITAKAPLFFVKGNHDAISTQDGVPSCVPVIAHMHDALVADDDWRRFCLRMGPVKEESVYLWMVPYFRDPALQRAKLAEAAANARKTKASVKILAFHNEVKNCERSAFSKGDGLTFAEVFVDAYDLCVSGHIHRPQVVRSDGEKAGAEPSSKTARGRLRHGKGAKTRANREIHYAGSSFCVDWGEANEKKSLLIAEVDDGVKLSRVPSAVPGWHDPDVPGFEKLADWSGTTVRFKVAVGNDPAVELRAAKTKLEAEHPGARIVVVPDVSARAVAQGSIDLKGGDDAILRRYLEQRDVPDGASVDQMSAFIAVHLGKGGTFGVQRAVFGKTEARRVLSFEEVSVDFDQKGMTLVTGNNVDWSGTSNGSGKTSLVTLPFLAIFGKTFKEQSHDEWAMEKTEKAATLRQEVKLESGEIVTVERGRRPSKLVAKIGAKDVSMGTTGATQTLIEKWTNATWSVITNSVYIGQKEVGSVFGTEKERKELFARLLGLERFSDAAVKMKKVLRRCEFSEASANSEVFATESQLKEAKTALAEIEEVKKSCRGGSPKDVAKLEATLASARASMTEIERKFKSLDEAFNVNQKNFEKLLFRSVDLENQITRLEKEKAALSGIKGACPTCKTVVDVKKLESSVSKLSSEIERVENENGILEEQKNQNRARRKVLFSKLEAARKEKNSFEREAEKLLEKLAKEKENAEALGRISAVVEKKKARVLDLEKNLRIHEAARSAAADEVGFVEACIASVGRDGLPAFLCEATAPALNAAALRYSEIFSDGAIGVEFKMTGGDIDVSINNASGGSLIKGQSAGEMRMAGIIAAFSSRDVLVPHNVLVLDEPGAGLDAVNAKAFAKGLKKVTERFDHVIVISHDPNLLSELEPDRRWEVTKKDGVSKLTEHAS